MKILLVYLLLINAASFLLMLADKKKARRDLWRIPEKVLFGAAALGGSLGIWAGMYACRHKTKHKRFVLGIPAILLAQILLFLLLRNML